MANTASIGLQTVEHRELLLTGMSSSYEWLSFLLSPWSLLRGF
jgi:hypothetical protein